MASRTEEKQQASGQPDQRQQSKRVRIRNSVAFWFLGLCNNYGFTVMLSAAHDILSHGNESPNVIPAEAIFNVTNSTGTVDCNALSTGIVLLADIVPETIVSLIAPWVAEKVSYDIRAGIWVVTAASSFLLVGLAQGQLLLSLLGVALTSISAGIGAFTFISMTSLYGTGVVSAWSSGAGAAGLLGSVSYAVLTEVLTPGQAVLVMLVVPPTMIISYWVFFLRSPTSRRIARADEITDESQPLVDGEQKQLANGGPQNHKCLTLAEKLGHLKHLMKYMLPLLVVYTAQYFTNQGLLELVFFRKTIAHSQQYRWYQVLYRIGTLIGRSSVDIVRFKRLWVLALLQCCILALIFTEACFTYMPSIAIVFALILVEGFVGGATYVNTFYQIKQNERPKYEEFALGTTYLATTVGTTFAGILAMPVHDALCWRD